MRAHLGPKTKIVLLNSPNNPSGVSWGEENYTTLTTELLSLRALTGRIVHIMSDEPYSKLVFKAHNLTPLFKLYDASWIVRSHSKDLGLAGDRIGYFSWSSSLHSSDLLGCLRNSARALGQVNASAFLQRLLPLVGNARVNVGEYKLRTQLFLKLFGECKISCASPAGGFFLFPKSPSPDEMKFVDALLQQGVLVVAGRGFGKPGYVRLSLTRPMEELQKAAQIFCVVYASLAT
jgi:aspartate aminotransferase